MKKCILIRHWLIMPLFLVLSISSIHSQYVIQSWATLATGASPFDISIDATGNVYTPNNGNSTISKITPAGVCSQSWVALATSASPRGIAIYASGYVYTANKDNTGYNNNTVSRITTDRVCTSAWTELGNNLPNSIVIDASGNVYTANTAEYGSSTVSKITPEKVLTLISLASYANPVDIAVDVSGNIYTANNNNTITKITPSGVCTQNWATLATGATPRNIIADASGNVFTANGNNTVSKITKEGVCTPLWATLATGASPRGITVDALSNVFTANNNNTVSKITPSGVCTQSWATLATGASPRGIAIDAFGNIYTANYNNTVSKITTLPTILSSKPLLTGFTYQNFGPSVEQSFIVSGGLLNSSINLTSPSNYEISTESGANFTPQATITLSPTNGTLNAVTVYVRLKAGLATGTYNESILLTSDGATSQSIALIGTLTPATITISRTSISGFSYSNTGPSPENTFTVSGSRIVDGVVITPSSNYEISIFSGTNFIALPSITLAPSNGIVTTNTIYVRLKSGIASGSYNEIITLTSTGADTKTVSLSGTLTPPTITLNSTSLSGFSFNGTGPSAEKIFNVSGGRLVDKIIITPSSNYEISIFSGVNFIALASITLTPTDGVLATTTIYVRLKAGIAGGSYNESIILTSTGADTKTITLAGTVTNPAIVTSVSTINGLNYISTGPSIDKYFTVSGIYLGSAILITAPTNFEISLGTGSAFVSSSPIILSVAGGNVTNTNIYSRLKAELANGTYTGNIQLISTGAPTQTIGLTGIVGTTALQDIAADGIKVYVVGKSIIFEGVTMNSSYVVYSIYGSQLVSGKLNNNKIEVNNLQAGVYLIKINNKIAKVVME